MQVTGNRNLLSPELVVLCLKGAFHRSRSTACPLAPALQVAPSRSKCLKLSMRSYLERLEVTLKNLELVGALPVMSALSSL